MYHFRLISILIFLFFECAILKTKADFFTSVVGLENLLQTKVELIKALEKYLQAEEERLERIRTYKQEYQQLLEKANPDVESFITNPINAYLLVKRLSADWNSVKNLLNSYTDVMEKEVAQHPDLKFPDNEDLAGAAEALIRLQETYKLNTSMLADGYILNTRTSQTFTAGDCYEISLQAFKLEDFRYSYLWMKEARERLNKETIESANREDVLEILAYAQYRNGNIEDALEITLDLLDIAPDNERAINNKNYFESVLYNEQSDETETSEEHQSVVAEVIKYRKLSESLCRGERIKSVEESGKLTCRYHTNNNRFLVLQPLKEEELFLDPRIVIYHDFLTDKEIDVIKTLSQPKLKRAAVASTVEGEELYSNYRISKSAWLKDEEDPILVKINNRITSATNLSLTTAEDLQVLNYGIGGFYDAHFDFSRAEEGEAQQIKIYGDRIATWLNYMSDVEAGGATVFPELGISVKPKKGLALLWYNLHRNGTGDIRTRHCACPVLLGSKWVSNKWIREREQEFRRKCSLQNE